jgi:8-oxo-dGTP pyrophosphatase MutT (NUDIX family)
MFRAVYSEELNDRSPESVRSRHALARAEGISRRGAELETEWLQLSRVIFPDGEKEDSVEFLSTPDESAVVPFTKEGAVVLVRRPSPALGESIITVLTRARIDGLEPDLVALQALHKLDIPGNEDTVAEPIGTTNTWKYIDSETHYFAVRLPVTTSELAEKARIHDAKTESIITMNEEEFFAAVDAGDITDLRTIIAVQLALAKINSATKPTDMTFRGDPYILELLNHPLDILRIEPVEDEVSSDWFPREAGDGDTIILTPSHQAQALGILRDKTNKPYALVLLVEQAQGKLALTLPSGSIEDGDTGLETAVKETKQETGFIATEADADLLVSSAHVMPLYLRVRSEVWEVNITGKGEKAGGDERGIEQGEGVIVPITEVWWYIENGYIKDASVVAGIFSYMRKHGVPLERSA